MRKVPEPRSPYYLNHPDARYSKQAFRFLKGFMMAVIGGIMAGIQVALWSQSRFEPPLRVLICVVGAAIFAYGLSLIFLRPASEE